jgi:hypothetical protein
MKIHRSATAVSWIPSEAIVGGTRLPFEAGIARYDEPPPDVLGNLPALRDADRFRFANHLGVFIEVDSVGAITDAGYDGGGLIGSTTMRLRGIRHSFQAIPLPDIKSEPEYGDGWVRFAQTAGGRTGVPAPRRVRRAPYVQWQAPLAWTTLSLTVHADGTTDQTLVGASRFPRHWVYDTESRLVAKSGLIDFKDWYRKSFGTHTPWGDQDSPALVTEVESALERVLSKYLMAGDADVKTVRVKRGSTLVHQGDAGSDAFLVLDGVLRVEVDDERLAEYGPGAILGVRAHIEDGTRTSSLIAVTDCKVARVPASSIDRSSLEELAAGHRREGTDGV